jgi:predicted aspartyl protease
MGGSQSNDHPPRVDTGFNGSVAIDRETAMGLHVTPKGMVLIRTARGYSETPIYPVKIRQLELGIDYTTLAIGAQRWLVGRTLLKDREWLLDFRKGRFCLMTAPP